MKKSRYKSFLSILNDLHYSSYVLNRTKIVLITVGLFFSSTPLMANLSLALNQPFSSNLTEKYFDYLKELSVKSGCTSMLDRSSLPTTIRPFSFTQINEQDILLAIQKFGPNMINRVIEQTGIIIDNSIKLKGKYTTDLNEVSPILSCANGTPFCLEDIKLKMEKYRAEGFSLASYADVSDKELQNLSGKVANLEYIYLGLNSASRFFSINHEALEMAETVNKLFQSIDLMSLFFAELLTASLVELSKKIDSGDPVELSTVLATQEKHGLNSPEYYAAKVRLNVPQYIEKGSGNKLSFIGRHAMYQLEYLAKREGWNGVIDLHEGGYGKMKAITNSNYLYRDVYSDQIDNIHPRDAHLLQSVLSSIVLNFIYGPGSSRRFFDWMGEKDGGGVWILLYDRTPNHIRDFRAPTNFGFTRYCELLGLR